MKRRRAKKLVESRKRRFRRLIIVGSIMIVAVIIIATAIYYINIPSTPKKPAEEYFEIKNIAAFCENASDPSKKLVVLLGFNLTALGDAHNVYIKVDSMIERVHLVGNMGKGESKYVEIKLRGYLTHLEEDGYPVEVWIGSSEAEGYITVYIPPENMTTFPKGMGGY